MQVTKTKFSKPQRQFFNPMSCPLSGNVTNPFGQFGNTMPQQSPFVSLRKWRRCWGHPPTWRKPEWPRQETAEARIHFHAGELQEARHGSRGFPRKGGIKHKYCHRGVIPKGHVEENFSIIDHLKTKHIPSYRNTPKWKTFEQNRQWGISSSIMFKGGKIL